MDQKKKKKSTFLNGHNIGDERAVIRECPSYSMLGVPDSHPLNVIATTQSLWQTEKWNVSTHFQMSTGLNNHFVNCVPNNILLCGVHLCYKKKKCS